ncbi:hypothetical protein RvY_00471 [Ramazzottius varieornatus]|uniref:Glycoamylase-like domain-containing protein n=1 Tax=Ramazzottius varieornatus TaxID=947166 RepID=A0A1D1UDC4_RAMVA|nr:hypothetical protein RvY_00471 [Ramazzottius varieornatus]
MATPILFVKFGLVLILLSLLAPKSDCAEYVLTPDDNSFLDDLQERAFRFFYEHSNPVNGLTLDRAFTDGRPPHGKDSHTNIASTACTGYALVAYCIGVERGWITRAEAIARTTATLTHFAHHAYNIHGWFYHWINQATGEREWKSEISSIDTALLLGGILTVRQYFAEDKNIVCLATEIYERVDFQWMLNGHKSWLSHGWIPAGVGWDNEPHPDKFLESRWTDYSEQTMLNLLAIASPKYPIDWKTWYDLKRNFTEYGGYKFMAAVPPLFIHQYSHAFFDYRNKRERYEQFNMDYFQNSITATEAQRAFFMSEETRKDFPTYSENIWGMTASDTAAGYRAWGAPPRDPEMNGTVVPCAAGGSLMFAPEITLSALKAMKSQYGESMGIYKRYGFTDAFNPDPRANWVNQYVLGIDVGITLLSAENLRTGNVWKWFMTNPEATNALKMVRILPSGTDPAPSSATTIKPIFALVIVLLELWHATSTM